MTSMNASPGVQKYSFFREHVLPVCFIFLIPVFSLWFFAYAETNFDDEVLRNVRIDLDREVGLAPETKTRILAFYEAFPASRIMASSEPELVGAREMLEPLRSEYANFRWLKRIAWGSLITVGVTLLIVGLSVAFSFRSQSAQYLALRIGWPVLRTSVVIQVLAQAVLVVALSYWVTAILTNSYYLKLIGLAGALALAAVCALLKAIFTKLDNRFELEGENMPESDAPRLWQRVREMAARLNTAAPDQILLGIEPKFFVTEHLLQITGKPQSGRTLYLSLPMLKVLTADEAGAILGHELAHFSGQDTLWSARISPLIAKFALYLHTLAQGFTLIVAHFMHLFWKLYNISIARLSREREFRADRVGAELVSRDAMKRALLKVTCYCEYRAATEIALVESQRVEADLLSHIEQGYPAFLSSFASKPLPAEERVTHPFDTHPALHNRLAELGFESAEALGDQAIQSPVNDSWYYSITTAQAVEARLFAERQKLLQSYQSLEAACRLTPTDEEELAVVLEHFPAATFRNKKGLEATLEFDRIKLPNLPEVLLFSEIADARLNESMFDKRVVLTYLQEGKTKPAATPIVAGAFTGEKGDLLALFLQYYSRHAQGKL